jgi:Dickkopf N-terminal cysteine-rich region
MSKLMVGFCTLMVLATLACKGHSEGSSCTVGENATPCGEGLFCESSGRMNKDLAFEGTCQKQKPVGRSCSADNECVPPAHCATDPAPANEDPTRAMERSYGTGPRSGHCQ